MKYILLILLCCSCAGIQPSGGFFGNQGANQAGANAGNAAMDAGNAAANHTMHHTPPPMPMAAPGF